MHHTYILYSTLLDRYYIGYTANLQERLYKHKARHKGFTGAASDWKLVYSESFASKEEAMSREKQIKGWKSRRLIEALVQAGSAG